jgi:hypothetical protein
MHDYPTVLIARDDDGLDGVLVHRLRRNGFHVLEAGNWEHVFVVVKVLDPSYYSVSRLTRSNRCA